MRLPKVTLELKLLLLLLLVLLVPLFGNFFWFHTLLQASSQEAAFATKNLILFVLIILIITFLIVILVSLLMIKEVITPLKQLQKGARLLGKGDLDYRFEMKRTDEIGDVAKEFNNMADILKHTIGALASQNKVLSILRKLEIAGLSTTEIEALCQSIVDIVARDFEYLTGLISIIDYKKGVLQSVALSKQTSVFRSYSIPLTLSENVQVQVIEGKQSIYTLQVADIYKGVASREAAEGLQFDSHSKGAFVYPLVAKQRVIGTLVYLTELEKENIPSVELGLLDQFTAEAGRVLDNVLLYQDLRDERTAISAERNKLEVVISGISDAVIAVDLTGNIIIFNTAAEKLIGAEKEDVLGKPLDDVINMFDGHSTLPVTQYCPIQKDGFEGVVFHKKELRLVGPSNKESFVDLVSGRIKEAAESNLGCILAFHDVTEEKKLEEMKLDFVTMAAHELRTPLTSLKGYLSVFIQENKDIFNDEQKMFLNRMDISAYQLAALVENLLNVSRIERGVFTIDREPLDWVENLRLIINEFLNRTKERQLSLTLKEPEKGIGKIYADKLRINEVFSNLLSNAIAYTQPGGSIIVSVEDNDNEVITHIEDSGQGIPKEAIPKLFTKFFRVSGVLESGSKGTGLGLYLSKAIVDMHHGRIWVESVLGKGSTFSFAIPKEVIQKVDK